MESKSFVVCCSPWKDKDLYPLMLCTVSDLQVKLLNAFALLEDGVSFTLNLPSGIFAESALYSVLARHHSHFGDYLGTSEFTRKIL